MSNNSHSSARPMSKTVAVIIPMHSRVDLTPEEKVSLRHLNKFLGRYDKYMLVQDGINIEHPGFEIKNFDKKFFGSAKANNRLLLTSQFYKIFLDYKYILMYHLDCLVFSDELMQWCDLGFDYIAAPWIKHKDAPYNGNPVFEDKVGGGGFSLRKVESFLKILNSKRNEIDPEEFWEMTYGSQPRYIQYKNLPKKYLKYLKIFNCVKWETSRKGYNEDQFIAHRATHYYPDFTIASVETALRFAFECAPRYCFELNHRTLPFGCHAWHKYDRAFWEPYLLKAEA